MPTEKTIDYDMVSKVYDEVRKGDLKMISPILERMQLDPSSNILDAGCGTANHTQLLASITGAKIVGLDLSAGMLSHACRKSPALTFIQASIDLTPFPDASFDLVYMTEVLHHIQNFEKTIQELSRLLVGGGALCIVTQSHSQIESRATSHFFPSTVSLDKKRYPPISSIEDAMKRSGLNSVESISFQFPPVVLGIEYLETVKKKGYSMLLKLDESEYQEGLSKLQAAYSHGKVLRYPAGYTYVWGWRR